MIPIIIHISYQPQQWDIVSFQTVLYILYLQYNASFRNKDIFKGFELKRC